MKHVLRLARRGAILLCLAAAPASAACVGDCNGDGRVRVDELTLSVNIAIGDASLVDCPAALCGPSPSPIACLVEAVNNALDDRQCEAIEACPGLWCSSSGVCEDTCAEFLTADVDGRRMICLASMCNWNDEVLTTCVAHLVRSGEADCVPAVR